MMVLLWRCNANPSGPLKEIGKLNLQYTLSQKCSQLTTKSNPTRRNSRNSVFYSKLAEISRNSHFSPGLMLKELPFIHRFSQHSASISTSISRSPLLVINNHSLTVLGECNYSIFGSITQLDSPSPMISNGLSLKVKSVMERSIYV